LTPIQAARDVWPRVAVMGAGAVGCYFGGMLARAGAPVTLIGRRTHVEAIAREGLFLDSVHFQEHIEVAASTLPEAARGASLVLFTVKANDTEQTAQALAPHLDPGATILSLQNGADNVARIRAAAKLEALPAVVYVAAAMPGPGHVKHVGRGDLVIGDFGGNAARQEEIARLAATFVRAGVPCRLSENIEGDLWTKLLMNCAYNAISALGQARYGRIAQNPWTRDLMKRVTEEGIAVARAAGVRLPNEDLFAAGIKLGETMNDAISSTAQDIARGKRTEIDSLNGYIVRRGREFGIATPVNHALFALVKLAEENLPRDRSSQ
jgi:2-dehydropantoate 2-reductase